METNDENNQPLDTGHCLAPITGSSTLLMMAENGTLMTVCEVIRERAKLAADLEKIEQKLLSCNDLLELARYAQWCETRKKDFRTELTKLAEKLETKKRELTLALQQIDEQLTQQNLRFEWTIMNTFVSLIPAGSRPLNPSVVLRNTIIDQNLGKSSLDICWILDSNFRETERPPRFLPESWQEKYGVKTFVAAYRHPDCRKLVEPMISKRKQRGP